MDTLSGPIASRDRGWTLETNAAELERIDAAST
jgi:hypothetical protein